LVSAALQREAAARRQVLLLGLRLALRLQRREVLGRHVAGDVLAVEAGGLEAVSPGRSWATTRFIASTSW